MMYTRAECGTFRMMPATEPRKRPSMPSDCIVRRSSTLYGTLAPESTCRIHLSRWMGCLANVAAKPETEPETEVTAELLRPKRLLLISLVGGTFCFEEAAIGAGLRDA